VVVYANVRLKSRNCLKTRRFDKSINRSQRDYRMSPMSADSARVRSKSGLRQREEEDEFPCGSVGRRLRLKGYGLQNEGA
jgi:hypothetical protein